MEVPGPGAAQRRPQQPTLQDRPHPRHIQRNETQRLQRELVQIQPGPWPVNTRRNHDPQTPQNGESHDAPAPRTGQKPAPEATQPGLRSGAPRRFLVLERWRSRPHNSQRHASSKLVMSPHSPLPASPDRTSGHNSAQLVCQRSCFLAQFEPQVTRRVISHPSPYPRFHFCALGLVARACCLGLGWL